jgi:hypothetical protein
MTRRLHIAREESELGVLTETETRELLQAGFLLPTDLYWAEGMADWEFLAEFRPEPKAGRSSAALLKLAKAAVKSAGSASAAQAARFSRGWKSTADIGQSRLRATAKQMLIAFAPQIQRLVSSQLVKEPVARIEAAIHDDDFMRKFFGATYDCLPKPVCRFVTEEVFIQFCMERRKELLAPPPADEPR